MKRLRSTMIARRYAAILLTLAPCDGVSAEVRTYAVDQARSPLVLTGGEITVFGAVSYDVVEPSPGDFAAMLAGTVEADVATASIRVLATTSIRVVDDTLYLPGAPGSAGVPALGSYRVLYPTQPALGFDFTSITRGMRFSVRDASPTVVAAGGEFSIVNQTWTTVAGVADLTAGNPPQSDLTTTAPMANQPTIPGSIGSSGGIETIRIPISMQLELDANLIHLTLDFEGTIIATRGAAPLCAGDANGDGAVNFTDITTVLAAFGTAYPPGVMNGTGDADHNGTVNFTDITVVLSSFGDVCQ